MSPASCLYEGQVRHRRLGPVPHTFRYRLFMLYLDLEELPQLLDRVPFWSGRRPAPAWFRRADFLGDPRIPLDDAVRDLVEGRTGERPQGPIRLLTHLRYFGHSFNPVSFYYLLSPQGGRIQHFLAEVTNTPWKERHQYLLPVEGNDQRVHQFEVDKEFHVSPFMDMNHRYRFRFTPPGERLVVHIDSTSQEGKLFDATLDLERRPWSAAGLNRALVRYPLLTFKIVAAIHYQALRLWMKRVPFYPHPSHRAENEVSPGQEQT